MAQLDVVTYGLQVFWLVVIFVSVYVVVVSDLGMLRLLIKRRKLVSRGRKYEARKYS